MTVVSGKVTKEIKKITTAENSLILDQPTTASHDTFEATIGQTLQIWEKYDFL